LTLALEAGFSPFVNEWPESPYDEVASDGINRSSVKKLEGPFVGTYLSDYAYWNGLHEFTDLDQAQQAALEIHPSCGGITRESSGMYTLRVGTCLNMSRSAEMSWVVVDPRCRAGAIDSYLESSSLGDSDAVVKVLVDAVKGLVGSDSHLHNCYYQGQVYREYCTFGIRAESEEAKEDNSNEISIGFRIALDESKKDVGSNDIEIISAFYNHYNDPVNPDGDVTEIFKAMHRSFCDDENLVFFVEHDVFGRKELDEYFSLYINYFNSYGEATTLTFGEHEMINFRNIC
jgi:hypothetical protein